MKAQGHAIQDNIIYNKDSSREGMIFDNLVWLTTKETAIYLRKSVNAIHLLVSRKQIKARKFRNRLYFNKIELEKLINNSFLI